MVRMEGGHPAIQIQSFRPKVDYVRAVSFSAGSSDQFETVRSVYGPTNVRPTLRPVNSIDLTHPPLGTLSILG